MKSLLLFLFLGLAAFGGYTYYSRMSSEGQTVRYQSVALEKADLVISVTATGTLEPEDLVDVGAQVNGRVDELGIDSRGKSEARYENKTIDYGAFVEEGQMLAVIDKSVYLAQRNQAKAAYEHSQANLAQLESTLRQTEAEWERAQRLRNLKLTGLTPVNRRQVQTEPVEIKGISDADYVLAKANYDSAQASIDVGKATIAQNEAALQLAETNLGYTVIRSPVSGTIIDRRVNIGQTVVSSLNAPSLFLIAKDLRRMQIWASVNEADIGLIKLDMPVRFTVDTFPRDVFVGKVVQIRLNATMTQNVVTYTVVIENDNSDLKLLPYLTADVKFLIRQLPDSLLVPNSALRYQPPVARIDPEFLKKLSEEEFQKLMARQEVTSDLDDESHKPGRVWVQRENFIVPVSIRIGATDGSKTAVYSEELGDGDRIVIGEEEVAAATQEVNNPFGPPKIPRKKQGGMPPPPA